MCARRPYYPTFLGGIVSMRARHLLAANGFSNAYWGWGREDDDMATRYSPAASTVQIYSTSTIECSFTLVSALIECASVHSVHLWCKDWGSWDKALCTSRVTSGAYSPGRTRRTSSRTPTSGLLCSPSLTLRITLYFREDTLSLSTGSQSHC